MSAEGLAGLLRSFHLSTMAATWEESAGRAEQENWGYHRFLQHLCESEAQDRRERKMQRFGKDGITLCDPNRASEGADKVFQQIYEKAI